MTFTNSEKSGKLWGRRGLAKWVKPICSYQDIIIDMQNYINLCYVDYDDGFAYLDKNGKLTSAR